MMTDVAVPVHERVPHGHERRHLRRGGVSLELGVVQLAAAVGIEDLEEKGKAR